MTWLFILGAGFLVGWLMCAATWPLYRCERMKPPKGSYSLPPDHDWRRSINHENTAPNSSEERPRTFAELLMPVPRDRDPDWRRSFSHENTNAPQGPPPLKFRRRTDR